MLTDNQTDRQTLLKAIPPLLPGWQALMIHTWVVIITGNCYRRYKHYKQNQAYFRRQKITPYYLL